MSNARAPVLGQYVCSLETFKGILTVSYSFGAAMAGLSRPLALIGYCCSSFVASIRAYGAQEAFIKESLKRIDYYTRTARPFYNFNRW